MTEETTNKIIVGPRFRAKFLENYKNYFIYQQRVKGYMVGTPDECCMWFDDDKFSLEDVKLAIEKRIAKK